MNDTATVRTLVPQASVEVSTLLIQLLRDVIYRDDDERRWNTLIAHQAKVRDYVAMLNLDFLLDEGEGYAFLRGRPDPEPDSEAPVLLRLTRRYALSFPVSLLLALLRKKLAEFDAGIGGEVTPGTRLVLTRDEILEMIRVFLADSPNETRLADQLENHLAKIEDLGFLYRIKGVTGAPRYEVRRILKAFVDAQWLAGLDDLLTTYLVAAKGGSADAGKGDGDEEGSDGDE
jgi:hypothetical protein